MNKSNQKLVRVFPPAFYLLSLTIALSSSIRAEQTSSIRTKEIQQPTIAIIIDDMGNQYSNGADLARLPYPLTLSFLPERPHTLELIQLATENHKEIMLHSPMENTLGLELGYGGLVDSMNKQKVQTTLESCFKDIPHMVGINNHMGSKLTTNPVVMEWVMETISQHPYFFVDSRTTSKTVAAKVATSLRIPNLSRDIFLDHLQTRAFVQKQFLKLINIAKKTGTAVAIGHPHKVTIDYLTWALSKLDEKGISMATASAVWQIRHPKVTMQQYAKSTTQYNESIAQHADTLSHFPSSTSQRPNSISQYTNNTTHIYKSNNHYPL